MLDERGVPAMVTCMGANAELTSAEVRVAIDQLDGRVLLTQFEIPPAVALEAARYAKQRGMLTIVNPAPAPTEPLSGLEAADILLPNESEARQLLGLPLDAQIEDALLATRLREQSGAGCVLITLGERGLVGVDAQGAWSLEPPVVQAADTSGAGDVFCAALALSLARGSKLRNATAWACRAAALSVTRPGTIPGFPTLDEVEAFSLEVR